MESAAKIAEAARAWDKAEKFYRRLSTNFVPDTLYWFQFCQRTGRGDLEAARRATAAKVREFFDEGNPCANAFASSFYWHDGQRQKAIDALESHFQSSNDPVYGLPLALAYDRGNEREKCLATLRRVKAEGYKYTRTHADKPLVELIDLAVLLADDLGRGGKGDLDLMAVERLRASAVIADKVNIDYYVGKYFDLHGRSERAIAYWKRCLPYVWATDDARTSAAMELRQHGIPVDDYQPIGPRPNSSQLEQPPTK